MSALLQFGFPEAFFVGGFFIFFVLMLFGTGFFILPVIVAILVLVREDMAGLQKLVWILLVFFVPFVWLVYLVLGRERTGEIFSDL